MLMLMQHLLLLAHIETAPCCNHRYTYFGALKLLLRKINTVYSFEETALARNSLLLKWIIAHYLNRSAEVIGWWPVRHIPHMVLVSSVTTNALNGVYSRRVKMATWHVVGWVGSYWAVITIIVAKVSFAFATKQVLAVRFSLMDTALTSLSESLLAAIDAAYERFLSRMRIHVFCQVLLKWEFFVALWTWECLL